MKLDSLPDVPDFSPGVIGWNAAPVHGVEQSEQSDFVSLRFQLLRHLVRDGAAHAVAAQIIRALGLHAANLLHVKRRHLLDRCQAWTFAVEALGLQAIERLIGAKMARQLAINQHISATAVDTEKRRP